MAPEGYAVFISFNRRDEAAVVELAQKLVQRQLRPWLDLWDLTPGRPWQEEIETILDPGSSKPRVALH